MHKGTSVNLIFIELQVTIEIGEEVAQIPTARQ